MGDRLGRKRVFLVGVVIFTLASVWCGLTSNATMLIVARAVQGVGGALLTPGSLAIISATFPEDERGKAIGLWSGFSAITSAIGPVLGGWLIDTLSWRWVFFINVPFAIMVIGISLWQMPESRDEEATGHLDTRGAALVTVGFLGITYGFLQAGEQGFSHPFVLLGLIGGAITLSLFIWWEQRVPNPLMPLDLFKLPTFSGANLLTLLLYGALGGALFFLPLNLIQVQGYTATQAGLAFLPFILIMSVLSRWSGGLVATWGAKRPLILGPMIVALGFALLTWPDVHSGSYWVTYFPGVAILGLGMALVVAPLTTAVMNTAPTHQSGTASGINNAVARVAGLLGIAIFGLFALATFSTQLDSQLTHLPLTDSALANIERHKTDLAALPVPESISDEGVRADVQTAVHHAFVAGFQVVMWIASALSLVGGGMVAIFLDNTVTLLEKNAVGT